MQDNTPVMKSLRKLHMRDYMRTKKIQKLMTQNACYHFVALASSAEAVQL